MDINRLREMTSASESGKALQAALDAQSTSSSLAQKAMEAASQMTSPGYGLMPDYSLQTPRMPRMPKMPKFQNIWEIQSELFMEGLKSQVEQFEANLKPNQELLMICWHGQEKFQVLSVSMPSHNVVALNCRD